MRLRTFFFVALALVSPLLAGSVYADGIIGNDLGTFTILGGAGVTIGGTGSSLIGNVGACCTATSVTGVIPTNFSIDGTVQMGGGVAASAQGQLSTAVTALSGMAPTGSVSSLGGLTLPPGVYSSSSTMNLTGTLILDGQGNANALWVFQVGSSLTTASGSTVKVINTGSGAGVYWVLPTGSGSATLGPNSTFEGNILANISIVVDTKVTDPCGRFLTETASVTLAGTDTIGIGCSGLLAANGLSGGGTLSTGPTGVPVITPLKSASVPEPGTFALLLSVLLPMGLVTLRKLLA
jgi:Ice-binding-like